LDMKFPWKLRIIDSSRSEPQDQLGRLKDDLKIWQSFAQAFFNIKTGVKRRLSRRIQTQKGEK
jgi:hypothetical protein